MAIDLTNCDREPIHVPGSIQPHGLLLALDDLGRVTHASRNAGECLDADVDHVLGARCDELLGLGFAPVEMAARHDRPVALDRLRLNGTQFDLFLHRNPQGRAILELETATSAAPPGFANAMRVISDAVAKIESIKDLSDLMHMAVTEIRRITGWDRVMAYRFDEDYNGAVVAEDCAAHLPPYLEQHFPASDIPAQARELYRRNRLRVIGDVNYRPIPIESDLYPHNRDPLDLSHALLRSVSPIHVEYLQNMGVSASMSGSLLSGDRLWGLIACHHYSERRLPHEVRIACEVICQVLSLQLQLLEEAELRQGLLGAHSANQQIIELLAEEDDVVGGIQSNLPRFKSVFDCGGMALCYGTTSSQSGLTPDRDQLFELVGWLRDTMDGSVYATSHLGDSYPGGAEMKERASGLLALALGDRQDSYLLWFRPELVHTVTWAGNPSKPASLDNEGGVRLSPRKSFAAWAQEVEGRAKPWQRWEVDAAKLLGFSLLNVLIRLSSYRREVEARTEALEQSNTELQQFAYVASHDLKAPLRGIGGFAEILQEEYRDRLDDTANAYIEQIVDGTKRMRSLINDILAYSRVASDVTRFGAVDLNRVFESMLTLIEGEIGDSGATVTRDELPTVAGDPAQLSQLLQNLVLNGLKYNQDASPRVHVSATQDGDSWIVAVQDNGIGIAAEYHEKVFEIFGRLHSQQEYAGTGIGLAVCRRIALRHRGRIWLESTPGDGSTFYVSIPAFRDDAVT